MQLKIGAGEYEISSDSNCFTLYKISQIKKSDRVNPENIGKDRKDIVGYYPSLSTLLLALPSRVLMASDASGFKEIIAELREIKGLIMNMAKTSSAP